MKKLLILLGILVLYSCDNSKEIQAVKEKHIKDSIYAFAPEAVETIRERDSILNEKNKEIKQQQDVQAKEAREESSYPIYKVNKPMKLGDFIVTVLKTNEYKNSADYYQPKKGYRCFAICVEYENMSTTKILDANPFHWQLFDTDNYVYNVDISMGKEPTLAAISLNPSGKVKGWITFEIPKEAKPLKIQFQPNWLEDGNVEIPLN